MVGGAEIVADLLPVNVGLWDQASVLLTGIRPSSRRKFVENPAQQILKRFGGQREGRIAALLPVGLA